MNLLLVYYFNVLVDSCLNKRGQLSLWEWKGIFSEHFEVDDGEEEKQKNAKKSPVKIITNERNSKYFFLHNLKSLYPTSFTKGFFHDLTMTILDSLISISF